jgi:hypothetical protein
MRPFPRRHLRPRRPLVPHQPESCKLPGQRRRGRSMSGGGDVGSRAPGEGKIALSRTDAEAGMSVRSCATRPVRSPKCLESMRRPLIADGADSHAELIHSEYDFATLGGAFSQAPATHLSFSSNPSPCPPRHQLGHQSTPVSVNFHLLLILRLSYFTNIQKLARRSNRAH